jgi:hypothetical protein
MVEWSKQAELDTCHHLSPLIAQLVVTKNCGRYENYMMLLVMRSGDIRGK